MRVAALVLLALALGCRAPRPERPIGACSHVQASRELLGTALCEDVWTCVRPPGGQFDRVGLHRLAPCDAAPAPVVLYLPGMHMNGELPFTDADHDLRVYLAARGIHTWGLDYRTHAVPADATPTDLAPLARWNADVFSEDVAWAAAFVRGADPGPLVVAGFSHGATFAYRLAAREPAGVAGLVILDGRSAGTASAGPPVIDVGGGRLPFADRERLLAGVLADPAGPSPIPGYPTAGDALADVLYTAPSFGGQGGLADTRNGVSDLRVLARLLERYDRWWPRSTLGGAAPDAGARPLPVLAFASTRLGDAWRERVRQSALAYGGPQTTVRELPGYGHLDVLVARNASRDVFGVVLAWLERYWPGS